MLAYLKIKIVSLAAESRLIRSAEREWKKTKRHPRNRNKNAEEIFFGLKDHRKGIVRDEARWAQIAYGFLRGLRYDQVERPKRKPVNRKRVAELAVKYYRDTDRLRNDTPQEIYNLVLKWLDAD